MSKRKSTPKKRKEKQTNFLKNYDPPTKKIPSFSLNNQSQENPNPISYSPHKLDF